MVYLKSVTIYPNTPASAAIEQFKYYQDNLHTTNQNLTASGRKMNKAYGKKLQVNKSNTQVLSRKPLNEQSSLANS